MPQIIRAEVRLPFVTGLPRDVAINTFHWAHTTPEPTGDDFIDVFDRVTEFYNTAQGVNTAVGAFLSNFINRANCLVRMSQVDYVTGDRLGDWIDVPFVLTASTNAGDLPLEVALVSSQSAFPQPIVTTGRRRGRQFIGPLNLLGMQTGAAGTLPRPNDNIVDSITASAAFMAGYSDPSWVIWSRADASIHAIESGWVDNDWDTQRRRGADATARNPWP